jgi:uncharacterized protein YndB with AHSA1/START domain
MEYASIERELRIDASIEVVFEVISSPEYIKDWWNAETNITPTPGSTGELVWVDENDGRSEAVAITVVDVDPPNSFSFRWVSPAGEAASPTNSLLVSFTLTASGAGTVVHFSETGFREQGWEVAVLEANYRDHVNGWDTFLPRLSERAAQLAAAR